MLYRNGDVFLVCFSHEHKKHSGSHGDILKEECLAFITVRNLNLYLYLLCVFFYAVLFSMLIKYPYKMLSFSHTRASYHRRTRTGVSTRWRYCCVPTGRVRVLDAWSELWPSWRYCHLTQSFFIFRKMFTSF